MSIFTAHDSRFSRRTAFTGVIPFLTLAAGTSTIAVANVLPTLAQESDQATPETSQPVAFPDTAIGREFASLVDAINSGDPERLLAHFETYFPAEMAEPLAATTLLNSKAMGNLLIHRIDESTETSIAALVETTLSEEWLSVRLTHEDGLPQIDLSTGKPLPGTVPEQPLDDDALAEEMSSYLTKLAEADVFSGAVLVARDGEPVFAEAFGLADTDLGIANTLETRFNLGSMNKMFTAVAIAQLQESGKLDFSDPIALHLPGYPADIAEQVTIHHLLTHTSGLGDIFGPQYEQEKETLHTLRDYLELFVDEPLRFEPGDRHEYSNAGFIVLGLIIEEVSGQDYFDFVRERVFQPAGMNATDSFERDAETPDLAIGYTLPLPPRREDLTMADVLAPRQPNDAFLSPRGTSAGGGYSTVGDLLAFERALRSGILLQPETVAMLIEGKVDTFGPEVRYGYGFVDDRLGSQRIVGHTGGAPGINGALDMYWDLGATVIALANLDNAVRNVAMKAKRLLAPDAGNEATPAP
jgi:CubicO group peptidase (beta-lactamase class C family)